MFYGVSGVKVHEQLIKYNIFYCVSPAVRIKYMVLGINEFQTGTTRFQ